MKACELLYRTALETESERILVINAHAHELLFRLKQQCRHLDIQQHFKPVHAAINSIGLPVSQDWPATGKIYDMILLLPSKNKQQTHAWMAEAMDKLHDNGQIIAACANNHGAKSYESALKQLAGNTVSRSKSKCRIFSARKTSAFNAELAKQWIDTAQPHHIDSHGLISRPGLFSWDRADKGSTLLLGQLPSLTGTGMDLCCGYGLLANTILHSQARVKQIHLVEADRLALDCAIQNTQPWEQNIHPHWSDAASEALPDALDWIVCNPPFHSGQSRDVELGQSIVLHACKSLRQGGMLYLVANRKLPYERLLQSELRQCQTLIEADGFKVMQGIR